MKATLHAALTVIVFCTAGLGQGARHDGISLNGSGGILTGASIYVCSDPASGTPCTPLASLYSDVALTQSLANPLTSDAFGKFYFYALPGNYTIQIYNGSTLLYTLDNVSVTSSAIADKGGQVFNVMAYGAKGDGVTDDTAAIQNTVNTACSGTTYGTVYFPATKTFSTSSVGIPANCILNGGGTLLFKAGNYSVSLNSGDVVAGLTLNGNSVDYGAALYVNPGAQNFLIQDNTFDNWENDGSVLVWNGVTGPGKILDNIFSHDGFGSPPVFDVQCGVGSHDILIEGNHFTNEYNYSIGADGSNHIIISNNTITASTNGSGAGIQVEATGGPLDSITITGNQIFNFATCASCTGIHVVSTNQNATNVVISSNQVHNGGRGIVFETVGSGAIKQATLSNFIIHDIGLTCVNANWTNMIVTGGVIYNCGENKPGNGDTNGLYVGGGNEIVSNNMVFDNQSTPTTGCSFNFATGTHGINDITGGGTAGICNSQNLVEGKNFSYSFAVTTNPQSQSYTLGSPATYLVTVLWQPAGSGGTWTVMGGMWFVSTWGGYPGTVANTGIAQVASLKVDNALGATFNMTGALNNQITVTATGGANGTVYIYIQQVGSLSSSF
ncbi:MAG TPA: glycosyl hydrolase family 28-related protein [Terriglobia bacterium]|nr:glycosyl hydrolase family 28-related protein [Terriglobia bacterium]